MEIAYDFEKYANRSDEELALRARLKEEELKIVFEQIKPNLKKDQLIVAILGCPDSRMISSYSATFQKLLNMPCGLIIYDKVTDHLLGLPTVVRHDVTMPYPISPFDIIYSHVILKYVAKEKQFDLLKNSYDALEIGGIAVHIMDKEEIDAKELRLEDGWHSVNLTDLIEQLEEADIDHLEVPFDVQADPADTEKFKIRGVKGTALVLRKALT